VIWTPAAVARLFVLGDTSAMRVRVRLTVEAASTAEH
jgi:hypothetical protein